MSQDALDMLDAAYMALGAEQALKEATPEQYKKATEGLGHSGLMAEVVQHTPLLAAAWVNNGTPEIDFVWYYEVSRPFGYRYAKQLIERGHCDAESLLHDVVHTARSNR